MQNYHTQKKMVIAVLSVICLCLAAGLIYYLGYIDRSPAPSAIAADNSVNEPKVTVPSITVSEDNSTGEQTPGTGNEQDKESDGEKPKNPEEEKPPEKPTVTDEKDLTNPSKPPDYTPEQKNPDAKTDTPKGGDKKDGKIFVPGFGWVEDSGESNTQSETDNGQHNGNKVGEM